MKQDKTKISFSTRNARPHLQRQVRRIAASIKSFGFVAPILIDESSPILVGEGRRQAVRLLNSSKK